MVPLVRNIITHLCLHKYWIAHWGNARYKCTSNITQPDCIRIIYFFILLVFSYVKRTWWERDISGLTYTAVRAILSIISKPFNYYYNDKTLWKMPFFRQEEEVVDYNRNRFSLYITLLIIMETDFSHHHAANYQMPPYSLSTLSWPLYTQQNNKLWDSLISSYRLAGSCILMSNNVFFCNCSSVIHQFSWLSNDTGTNTLQQPNMNQKATVRSITS